MTSEGKPEKEFNVELLCDVSRCRKRHVQVILTVIGITLLYLVTSSQLEKPPETINDNNLNIQQVAKICHQIEIRQQVEEGTHMTDVDNSPVVVPEGPPFGDLPCETMLEDIDVAPRGSLPLVALASFPRSGNTWTRMLLQVASKLSTGSVYWETERKYDFNKKTFKAGTEDFQHRTSICVKTHMYAKEHVTLFTGGAILLLRNPYFSLVSEFFRELVFDGNRTREDAEKAILAEPRWKNGYFPNQSGFWRETNLNWIKYCKRLLVVFYEDLERNPTFELSRMLQFLQRPIQLNRLSCALQLYAPDLNHTYLNFDPYTPEQYERLDGYIAEVSDVLVARNGRPLPKYKYEYQSSTPHYRRHIGT